MTLQDDFSFLVLPLMLLVCWSSISRPVRFAAFAGRVDRDIESYELGLRLYYATLSLAVRYSPRSPITAFRSR